jgi:hypothetical protein
MRSGRRQAQVQRAPTFDARTRQTACRRPLSVCCHPRPRRSAAGTPRLLAALVHAPSCARRVRAGAARERCGAALPRRAHAIAHSHARAPACPAGASAWACSRCSAQQQQLQMHPPPFGPSLHAAALHRCRSRRTERSVLEAQAPRGEAGTEGIIDARWRRSSQVLFPATACGRQEASPPINRHPHARHTSAASATTRVPICACSLCKAVSLCRQRGPRSGAISYPSCVGRRRERRCGAAVGPTRRGLGGLQARRYDALLPGEHRRYVQPDVGAARERESGSIERTEGIARLGGCRRMDEAPLARGASVPARPSPSAHAPRSLAP